MTILRRVTVFCGVLLFVTDGIAQQNFINVPSSDITPKGRLFFQQQLNFNALFQSNSTFDLGIGYHSEIGVNLLGVDYSEKNRSWLVNDSTDRDPYNPLIAFNGATSWDLGEHTSFAVGGQGGVNFDRHRSGRPAGLAYANLRIEDLLLKESVVVLGPYYNTEHYGGAGNRLGGWIGAEVPMSKVLHVMAESVLGDNAISYTSLGLVVYPVRNIPLTLGVQIPNTSNNAYSIVFELTVLPMRRPAPTDRSSLLSSSISAPSRPLPSRSGQRPSAWRGRSHSCRHRACASSGGRHSCLH